MAQQGMDPLMKKIYGGIAGVALLLLVCGGCYLSCGGDDMETTFVCTGKDAQGAPCPGKQVVKHKKDKPPQVPN